MLLSARHLPMANVVEATGTPDRFRDVLHHFNTGGVNSPKFDTPVVAVQVHSAQRQQIKAIALSRLDDHDMQLPIRSLPSRPAS